MSIVIAVGLLGIVSFVTTAKARSDIAKRVRAFNERVEPGNLDKGDEMLMEALHLVQVQLEMYAANQPKGYYPRCICNELAGPILFFHLPLNPFAVKKLPLTFRGWKDLEKLDIAELPAGTVFYLPELDDSEHAVGYWLIGIGVKAPEEPPSLTRKLPGLEDLVAHSLIVLEGYVRKQAG
ncbi:MAG: hypothetical protein B1H03_03920 [Planctomycetales bacterium 4484_113]|nr:MAG: hypothetical protein B1H03_03920 [Planctomycetales bacterium 4484_113]